eukprot:3942255-Alexandrium_andersonii.AAC.1
MPRAVPAGPARWSASNRHRKRADPSRGSAAADRALRIRTSPRRLAPEIAGAWMELLGGETSLWPTK